MAPGTALRGFLSHHQPEKQRFQPGPQPPEVLWHLPRAAGLQAGRRREASSFLSRSPADGERERGVPGAGSAAPRWAPRTVQVCLLLLHSIPMLPESCAASPCAGFLTFEPPTNPPKFRNAPGYWHHPPPGAMPGPPGRCGASEGSATPVSSCLPSPGQHPAAEPAPGFGSLGGPAEPAGLPGEPCPGLEPQPQERQLRNPLCQGSSGQRHSPAPVGREQPGAGWSLSVCPAPAAAPQRRIFGRGRLLGLHQPGLVPVERNGRDEEPRAGIMNP